MQFWKTLYRARKAIAEWCALLTTIVALVKGATLIFKTHPGQSWLGLALFPLLAIAAILVLTMMLCSKQMVENQVLDANGERSFTRTPTYSRGPRIVIWAGLLSLASMIPIVCTITCKHYEHEKLIVRVVLAKFAGPGEENYRLEENIAERLRATAADENIEIVEIPDRTISGGSTNEATALGQAYNAKFVIWGEYGKTTSNVQLILHVLGLNGAPGMKFVKQGVMLPRPIEALECFRFQMDTSKDISYVVLTLAGIIKVYAGNYEEADSLLNKAVTLHNETYEYTNDWIAYAGKALVDVNLGKLTNALEDTRNILRLDPTNISFLTAEACVARTLGDRSLARSDLTNACALASTTSRSIYPPPLYLKAMLDFEDGNSDLSLSELNHLLVDYTNDSDILGMKAKVLAAKGEYQQALNAYNQALAPAEKPIPPALTKSDFFLKSVREARSQMYLERANLCFQHITNGTERAYQDAIDATRLNESNFLAWLTKGEIDLTNRDFKTAIVDMDKAIRVGPSENQSAGGGTNLSKAEELSVAYSLRGMAFLALGQGKKAADDFGMVNSSAAPEASNAIAKVALQLTGQIGPQTGLEQLRKIAASITVVETRIASSNIVTVSDLTNAAPEVIPALAQIKSIAELNPRNADISAVAGLLCKSTGDPIQARAYLDRALTINPTNRTALIGRSGMAREVGDWDAALKDLNQLLKYYPSLNEERLHRAQALIQHKGSRRRDWLAALDDFEQILKRQPSPEIQGEVYLNRASLYYSSIRDESKAYADLAQARAIMPESPEVYYLEGSFEIGDKNFSNGIADINAGLKRDKNKSTQAMLMKGAALIASGLNAEARSNYLFLLAEAKAGRQEMTSQQTNAVYKILRGLQGNQSPP